MSRVHRQLAAFVVFAIVAAGVAYVVGFDRVERWMLEVGQYFGNAPAASD